LHNKQSYRFSHTGGVKKYDDLNKTQEVDAGDENDAAEVEVEDDTIASPDEVAID
jgi:hypothetical protein